MQQGTPDALAPLFAGMKVDTYPPARLECMGDWAMDFPRTPYVRFASVYKNFREAKDFEELLGELSGEDDNGETGDN